MQTFRLDHQGSLQSQVYRTLRSAIQSGQLESGVRLAPSRQLAASLAVSRNTIVAAYEQLCAEGYAETRAGSGTFVSQIKVSQNETKPTRQNRRDIQPQWASFASRLDSKVSDQLAFRQPRQKLRYNFLYGEPGYADLPIGLWSRIVGKKARELTETQLGYAPTGGLPELKKNLAEYLQRSRGVVCQPEQVIVVQGTQEAIDLIARAFVDVGSVAVIEEPHYRGFRRCLQASGAKVRAIPVDEDGLKVDELHEVVGARVAYTTPSHQFPVGSILSLQRRTALLEWASKQRTVVVEDDYDGEFRYEGKPIPCLQSLDQNGCVIYVGTASKILFPSLRMGWMVVPPKMISMFEKLKTLSDTNCSTLEQLAFSEFVGGGHLERHIHRVRSKHQNRRAALLETMSRELGDRVEVTGTGAGIHVLVRFRGLSREHLPKLIELAAEKNVGVYPSANYYYKPPKHAELLMGYASLTPSQIITGTKRLAEVVRLLELSI